MRTLVSALILIMIAVLNSANAQVVPFNGHYYEFIQLTADISWTDARAAALSRTYKGMSGYLVNITSAEEQAFVLGLTPEPWVPNNPLLNDGWIGATDKDVEGDWIWADGPEGGMVFWRGDASGSLVAPFVYENWGRLPPEGQGDNDEPNDFKVFFPGGEDYAHLQGFFGWNDLPNIERTPRRGYFVEYGGLIDIKPNDENNTINICARGKVSVAIFSSNVFDATQVDPATVTLGGAGIATKGKDDDKFHANAKDVNSDGIPDLVVKFEIQDLGLGEGDTEATLKGMTFGGMDIEGVDFVEIKQQMCRRALEE